MKSIVLLTLLLIAVVFGASRIMPAGKGFKATNLVPKSQKTPTPGTATKINITKNCPAGQTPSMTDGPYYRANSPKKTVLREDGITGSKFILTGYVFDTNCNPISNAWIDFWQADPNGEYDNIGYKLRGHQFTDSEGKYYLETVIPGQYTSRTPHIHVKVQGAETGPQIITQLYFPGNSRNSEDPIFDRATLIKVRNTTEGKVGTYNFNVPTNQ